MALVGWIIYPNNELGCLSLNFFSRSARTDREIVNFFFPLRTIYTSILYFFCEFQNLIIKNRIFAIFCTWADH
jgi:hypothetical protein